MGSKVAQSLSIVLGYACTFKCRHCAIIGPAQQQLSPDELALLGESINRYRFGTLVFVGGEPTLYIPAINAILAAAAYKPRVIITTNGSFAVTAKLAEQTLRQIPGLNEVQLSYDKFHNEFLGKENAGNLKAACDILRVRFGAVLTIQSPMDIAQIGQLRQFGKFPIGVQKVVPFGAAKQNNIAYAYPSFDKEVLSQCCPNKDGMVYMCGRGFSVCDIPRRGYERFFYQTVDELQTSGFYRDISSLTFGELAEKAGLNGEALSPAHSSPCVLCEELFSRTEGNSDL
ncbi:MAG: hypothetical protein A2X32_00645 [Elusimicrobia bacterium GWC2_64_44]|nr:MAG: hypothetical protein A2X32_00645 [Elusimicrobia bacterium GWC2_64_44]